MRTIRYIQPHRCLTCGEKLNPAVDSDNPDPNHVAWRHGRTADHNAVPVPVTDEQPATLICDFCSTQNPNWTYPCRATNALGPDGEFLTDMMLAVNLDTGDSKRFNFVEDNPDFTACEECHQLIEDNDDDGLVLRSARLYLESRAQAARPIVSETEIAMIVESIATVHTRFRATRSGPAESLEVKKS